MKKINLNLSIERLSAQLKRWGQTVFAHRSFKRILGSNLAFMLIASSVLPTGTNKAIFDRPVEAVILSAPEMVAETQIESRYPLEDTIKVNQGFRFFHPGVDFEGETGDTVVPFRAGRVTEIGWDVTGYGNRVIIEHENGIESLYAHLSKISVSRGQIVDAFTKLGEVGSTGRSTGSHLHFEIRKNGIPINPFSILPALK